MSRGARALVWFWAALLSGAAVGAVYLESLGPPPVHEAAAPPAMPPAALAEAPPQASAQAPPTSPVGPGAAGAEAAAGQAAAVPPGPAAPTPPPPAPMPPPVAALAGRVAPPPPGTPRLAVLIHTLGQSQAATEAALVLPAPLGLAFSPYDDRSTELAARAQTRGHQVLVSLPLEPATFPLNNPGDRALMVQLPPEENLRRLTWALSRVPGAAGVTNALGLIRGERFLNSAEGARTLAEALRRQGLYFVEARPGEPPIPGVGAVSVDVLLDEQPGAAAFDARLAELERLARERGTALGLMQPTPVALERLGALLPGVTSRGVALVPPGMVLRAAPTPATAQQAAPR